MKSQQSDRKKRLKTLPVGPWRDGGARFHKSSLTTQDSFSTFSALQTFYPFLYPSSPFIIISAASFFSFLRLRLFSSNRLFRFRCHAACLSGSAIDLRVCVCACVLLLLARRVPLCVSVCDEDTEVACQQRQEAFNQAANRLRSLPSV